MTGHSAECGSGGPTGIPGRCPFACSCHCHLNRAEIARAIAHPVTVEDLMAGPIAEAPDDAPIQDPPFWAIITPSGRVDYRHGRPSAEELHRAVGGFLEAAPTDGTFTAYCNEDGIQMRLAPNLAGTRFTRVDQRVILGNLVIIGRADRFGDDTPLPAEIRMRLAAEVSNA